ncbi:MULTISPECIES: cytochrome oxidase small assembly protein [Roseateles]|uniref:Cytochrome oxidase small assembly protein n=2 Tax=Roseateles TaxID=93681 RepID=A0ABT2YE14_9BURK|nr:MULTISPECIES: cytochrome oxidase small assembly protein [Roseateles]MCV2359748.1 cytochrome oxidase small assembly protein [Paucibacter sp. TC2R-5]MCV2368295.1 cytochrome oxidase small assembly protein [Roseateles oligotrophus]MDC8772696.1 cytochrome oxidase small assembly protein [Roseateles albus]
MAVTPEQQKSNRRLALILLSVAIVFGVGFVSKIMLFGF